MAEKEKIQEAPEGWETLYIRNKAILEYGEGLPEEKREEGDVPVYGSNGIVGYHDNYLIKGPGIIIGRKGTVGAVNFTTENYWPIDTAYYIRFIGEGDNIKWFYYYLTTLNLTSLNSATGVPGLNRDDVYDLKIKCPPLPEQRAIASILSTCDEAIEKTDVKIEKLKRIKQGLMQDLFRFGIDENGWMRSEASHRFKDVPLGRIPEEWEVVELKNVTQSYDGMRFPIKEEDRQGINGNYPYYGASGVIDWINKCKYDGEYLLLAEDGENILSHNLPIAFIARGKFWVNNHVHVYQPNNDMSILFLQAYLDTLDYASFNTSSAQPKLTASACSKLTLVKPPKIEQSRIASVLSSADEAIEKEEAYKNKLLFIKHGLMDDLLSGKVRVNKLIKEAA